ncbi:MAG TPA: helix-turn-helix domain-containing protein, partial [Tepidisphaeraceae bacterium]
ARHFLQVQAEVYEEPLKRLTPAAAAALSAYAWPGNVRELANVIEHAHVLSHGDLVDVADLPPRLTARPAATRGGDQSLHMPTIERDTIAEALRRCGNNKAAASRLLGMNIQRLKRRMEILGVRGTP